MVSISLERKNIEENELKERKEATRMNLPYVVQMSRQDSMG